MKNVAIVVLCVVLLSCMWDWPSIHWAYDGELSGFWDFVVLAGVAVVVVVVGLFLGLGVIAIASLAVLCAVGSIFVFMLGIWWPFLLVGLVIWALCRNRAQVE